MRVQSPVTIPNHSEPEPDVTLLKVKPDFYASAHPQPEDVLIVIEVSDTTGRYSAVNYDRKVKRSLYAEAGISEMWLVNLEEYEIEVHRTPTADTYKHITILRPGDSVTIAALGVTIVVEDLLGEKPN